MELPVEREEYLPIPDTEWPDNSLNDPEKENKLFLNVNILRSYKAEDASRDRALREVRTPENAYSREMLIPSSIRMRHVSHFSLYFLYIVLSRKKFWTLVFLWSLIETDARM